MRQAYAFTRYDAHSGVSTAAIRTPRSRGDATLAMYSAIGMAITTSIRVTATATPTERSATLR